MQPVAPQLETPNPARFDFAGRVVIVTGASSGLGAASAKGFATAGANVVLGARRLDRLEQTKAEVEALGQEALAVETNVADPADCQRLVDAAMDRFGRVDVLINNAGVSGAAPATRETPEEFRAIVDVNLDGSYFMAQACGRVMKPGSSIVMIGSVLGSVSLNLPQAAYAASKAAIIAMTRDLAQQWTARKGIRVNAIAPGFFKTEMTELYEPAYVEQLMERIPAGRGGDPSEMVEPILFLSSDAASYITGVLLPVDGGLLTG